MRLVHNAATHLPEESIEPLSALVVLRVHPDDPDSVEQLGQEGGDGAGFCLGQLLAGGTQQGDEFQTVLCLGVAVLKGRREGVL